MFFETGFLFNTPECSQSVKISRAAGNFAFGNNYCFSCGKRVAQTYKSTGLPGISAHDCPVCGVHHMANFMDAETDLLDLPECFSVPAFIAFISGIKSEAATYLDMEMSYPLDSQRINWIESLKSRIKSSELIEKEMEAICPSA